MSTLGRLSELDVRPDSAEHTLTLDGTERHVSESLLTVVRAALEAAERGEVVEVQTLPELLTTAEAAQRLRVSRPTVVAMLERGDLAYTQPGTSHRKVSRQAVDDYLHRVAQQRKGHLDTFRDTHDPDHDTEGQVDTR